MIIYKTTNIINCKIYIGQDTKNNPEYFGSGLLIRRAITKYGIENFKKEILEPCISIEHLCEREKYWIKFYNSQNIEIGYNIAEGGHGGDTMTYHPNKDEICKRISIGRTGTKMKPQTDEHKRKIALGNRGKKRTSEHKQKIAKTLTGRKASLETRQKLSKLHKGRKLSDEHKRKLGEKQKGRKMGPQSEEHKQKIGLGNKGKIRTSEQRAKISATLKGQKHTPERVAKMIATKARKKLEREQEKLNQQ